MSSNHRESRLSNCTSGVQVVGVRGRQVRQLLIAVVMLLASFFILLGINLLQWWNGRYARAGS
jgi:hypothetical protein